MLVVTLITQHLQRQFLQLVTQIAPPVNILSANVFAQHVLQIAFECIGTIRQCVPQCHANTIGIETFRCAQTGHQPAQLCGQCVSIAEGFNAIIGCEHNS